MVYIIYRVCYKLQILSFDLVILLRNRSNSKSHSQISANIKAQNSHSVLVQKLCLP